MFSVPVLFIWRGYISSLERRGMHSWRPSCSIIPVLSTLFTPDMSFCAIEFNILPPSFRTFEYLYKLQFRSTQLSNGWVCQKSSWMSIVHLLSHPRESPEPRPQ
jgi:hypothetical protein